MKCSSPPRIFLLIFWKKTYMMDMEIKNAAAVEYGNTPRPA